MIERHGTNASPGLVFLEVLLIHTVCETGGRSRGRRRLRILHLGILLLVAAVFLSASDAAGFWGWTRTEPSESVEIEASDEASDEPAGRWRTARPRDRKPLTEEQQREIERLQSIGYLTGSQPAPYRSGVTTHDSKLSLAGVNLVVSAHRPGAALMDMNGTVLHEWSLPFSEAWPDRLDDATEESAQSWRYAQLLEDGSILAAFEGLGLIKVDKNSRLIWARDNGAHHDLDAMDDGTIYVLTREAHIVARLNSASPILEDFVEILDREGRTLKRVSLLKAFEKSEFANALGVLGMRRVGDIFHTNAIEVLDGSLADRIPAFRKGNVLISLRKLSLVAVVDLDQEKVVWAHAGIWLEQHMPTMLGNGNMLVFDNRGDNGRSRIVEFNPVTQEVAWVYKGSKGNDFFTRMCGANHRLANGNTLIVESDFGRAFEVTRSGVIVWEYVNPERAGNKDHLIATLFDVVRLPPSFPISWASGRQPPRP